MAKPPKQHTPAELIGTAIDAFQHGNIYIADAVCQGLLERGIKLPLAYEVLARIAQQVGDWPRTADYLQRRAAMGGAGAAIKQALAEARANAAQPQPVAAARYLVIKPWGKGFCSDLMHALSSVLLAEASGRRPIVWWDGLSLFRDEGVANAWESFFRPVSEATLDDASAAGNDFFPPKWNRTNIRDAWVNLEHGDWSRMAFLHYLHRPEAVTVVDYHCAVMNILPWLPDSHPSRGATIDAAYRRLFSLYFKPLDAIVTRADEFFAAHLVGRPTLAVHVRGSDKVIEDPDLLARNAEFIPRIEAHLASSPDAAVFLLTDAAAVADDYCARFGSRVVTTQVARTSTAEGVHFIRGHGRARLGEEVLIDILIAARCDRLLIGGTSNVSTVIFYAKDWPDAAVTRIGPSFHEQRYYSFYP